MQKKRIMAVWTALFMLVFSMNGFATNLSSNLSSAKNKLQQEQNQLNQYKNQQASLQGEIGTLDEQISNYEIAIEGLGVQIQEHEASIAQKEQEIVQAQQQCDAQTSAFKTRARISYEKGVTNYLLILLGSASFSEFLTNVETVSSIVRYDNAVLTGMKENKKKIEVLKAQIEQEKQLLEDNRTQQVVWMQDCESLRAQKQSEYDTVSANITATEQRIVESTQQVTQIQAQINQREAAQSSTPATPQNTSVNTVYKGGTLAWPTPSCYTITSYFGLRTHPISGGTKYHSGIDIGASYGADVIAADSGVVMTAARSSSYGNMIVIQHSNGLTTLYAHLSQINVSANQSVSRGQSIGKVGSTGNSTGPHLHFEVSNGASRLNPLSYLK